MAEQREKRVELILQQLEDLPALSPSADELLQQGGDALAIAVFQIFNSTPAESNFNRTEFWKHSIAVACCAELLAEELLATWGKESGVTPTEAFTAGLLHDLGKIALDVALPKSFNRVIDAAELMRGNIADVERTVIGLDHMVVGKRVAERWQLPATLRDCIWLHGQTPDALPNSVQNPRLVNLITLADAMAREQHLGYSGNYTFTGTRQLFADAIGLTIPQVDAVIEKVISCIQARAQALGFGDATTTQISQQALSKANQELSRVSNELELKTKRLAARTKFFDALAGFQGELRPDAPPQIVLKAIGQTAIGVLDVTSACAFSLMPGQEFAEALLFDGSGDVFETTLIDCNARPMAPPIGEGPVLSAGDELEWLLAAIGPRLAHSARYWICLEADGICVGGVVWGSMPGEGMRHGPQVQELSAISTGWSMALRTAQIREEARTLAEQLAEANRRLQNAQAEILRSKTMITVGEMAAGAAHEMNNPLAVISGRSQLLTQQLTDPKQKAAAHLVFEQSHRLADIISELMDFAKPVPPQPAETDLADLIDRSLHNAKMHTETADRSIEVTIGDVPDVIVDPQQVSAALVEIIDNALGATDATKGHITIHAAYDPYSQRVVMTVSDNGCGMDEKTVKRAFDPFFSSRPAGRRRGLGLAKALRWIEASGGSIRIESRPQQGTRTIILLPAAQPAATARTNVRRRKAQ